MRRRAFIGLVGGAALAVPFPSRAQKPPVRIGILFAGADGSATSKAQLAEIGDGLRDNDLIEGRDYVVELRCAAGKYERFPALATELAQAGAKMILANTIAAVRAAQGLAPSIPVVMVAINDPVGTGLIANLARPGGHTTGVATLVEDLTPKMLEFQQAIAPQAKVLGVIENPVNPSNPLMLENLRARAGAMGMTVASVALRLPEELDPALASLSAAKPDALHLLADAANLDLGDRISTFAIERRIPLLATYPPLVDFGCLLAYGPPRRKLLLRAGYYVNRILEGTDPANLPVEQPNEIELWVNLKTATALGIAMPFQLEQLANKVVE